MKGKQSRRHKALGGIGDDHKQAALVSYEHADGYIQRFEDKMKVIHRSGESHSRCSEAYDPLAAAQSKFNIGLEHEDYQVEKLEPNGLGKRIWRGVADFKRVCLCGQEGDYEDEE